VQRAGAPSRWRWGPKRPLGMQFGGGVVRDVMTRSDADVVIINA
jgi:hypothetical protein